MVEVKRKKIHGAPTLLYRFKGGYVFDDAAAAQLAAIDKSLFLPFSFDTTPKGTLEVCFDIGRMTSFGDWAKDAHVADELSWFCRDVAWAVDSCIKAVLPLKNVEFDTEAVFYDPWMQAFRFIYLPVKGIEPDASRIRGFVLDSLDHLTPADNETQRMKDRLIGAVGAKETEYDSLMVAKILRKESLGKSVLDDIARLQVRADGQSAARPDLREAVPSVVQDDVQLAAQTEFENAQVVEDAGAARSMGVANDADVADVTEAKEGMSAVDANCAFRSGGTIVLGLMDQQDSAPGTKVLGLSDDEEPSATEPQVEEPESKEIQSFGLQETFAAFTEIKEAEEVIGFHKSNSQEPEPASKESQAFGKHVKDGSAMPKTRQVDSCAAVECVKPAVIQDSGVEPESDEAAGDVEASCSVEYNETEDSEGQTTLLWSEPVPAFSLVRAKTKERIPILDGRLVVGKSVHSDYRIAGNNTVSRLHAVFDRKGDVCHVEDNKSLNGTFVNGVKLELAARVKLSSGDVIRLSDEDFLFEISDHKEGE